MHIASRRSRFASRPVGPARSGSVAASRASWDAWPDFRRRSPLGTLRAILRMLGVLALTLAAMPVQALLIALPGRAKVGFARSYWSGVSRVLGMRVRVIGVPAAAVAEPGTLASQPVTVRV